MHEKRLQKKAAIETSSAAVVVVVAIVVVNWRMGSIDKFTILHG